MSSGFSFHCRPVKLWIRNKGGRKQSTTHSFFLFGSEEQNKKFPLPLLHVLGKSQQGPEWNTPLSCCEGRRTFSLHIHLKIDIFFMLLIGKIKQKLFSMELCWLYAFSFLLPLSSPPVPPPSVHLRSQKRVYGELGASLALWYCSTFSLLLCLFTQEKKEKSSGPTIILFIVLFWSSVLHMMTTT